MANKKFLARVPRGIAAFAYIHKPDTGHQYSTNKYKVTVVLDGDTDMEAIRAKALEAATHKWGDKVPEADIVMPWRDGDDRKQEEFHGKLLITASSKFAPTVVDSKRKPLKKGVQVWSGDEIAIVVNLNPYEKTEKVREMKKTVDVKVFGVSAQLNIVQLIQKNSGGGGLNLLEDEEGFENDDVDDVDETDADVVDDEDNDGDY